MLGCDRGRGPEDAPITEPPAPTLAVTNLAVAPNPNNVLSAVATFTARGADSARLVYLDEQGSSGATPFTAALQSGRLVALGLRPSTTYRFFVEARKGTAAATSDTIAFSTNTLPALLAETRLESSAPFGGGYLLTGVGDENTAYVVAFDSTGAVAWYRAFDEGVPPGEIKQQANGNITAFLGATHGGQPVPGRYVELSPEGEIVRTFTAQSPAYTDNHELWLDVSEDGGVAGAILFTYTQRHLDLSASGGPADTVLSAHQLTRLGTDGSAHVIFDAWDHFDATDNVEPIPGEPDFDHPNAIARDPDGSYLVSWRNLDAITKIDSATGAIRWTLAAPWSRVPSDFRIVNDPLGGFSAQHTIRLVGDGHLLLFDNGTHHALPMSRAVEYALDTTSMTATLVWEYRHTPPLYTQFTGSVQRLGNGNTLVGWTWNTPAVATEVTGDGQVVWEGILHTPGTVQPYRFTRIASLYGYAEP